MAQPVFSVFPPFIGKTVGMPGATNLVLASGIAIENNAILAYNPGGLGSIRKISVFVESTSVAVAGEYWVYWRGIVGDGSDINAGAYICTAVPNAVDPQVMAYYADREGVTRATRGTPVSILGLFSANFLGIGIFNTGTPSITVTFSTIIELD